MTLTSNPVHPKLAEPAVAVRTPVFVDLDGTLVMSDTLLDAICILLSRNVFFLLLLPLWLLKGKSQFKHEVFSRVLPEAVHLPYRTALLDWLKKEASSGREVVLATATEGRMADAVAGHLGFFSAVLATRDSINLSGTAKLAAIRAHAQGRGFAYAGDSAKDLPIWEAAAEVLLVGRGSRFAHSLKAQGKQVQVWPTAHQAEGEARSLLRAMRPHQWLKNVLIFVPLLTAHAWGQWSALQSALLAWLAFSLCASSAYLINDLLDLEADRAHPRKRERPLAAGVLSPVLATLAAVMLLAGAGLLAIRLPASFMILLGVYLAATLAYSAWLKALPVVDVLTLAGLYTLRVLAGVEALRLEHSFWLLAFSMFVFFSLAQVKRCAELIALRPEDQRALARLGYVMEDQPLLQSMGVASGHMAVLVLALYINSEQVRTLYLHPERLWLVCPIMLFWISRVWLRTARGQMHDDPLLFAAKDPGSLLTALVLGTVIALAL
jgi:4-hydroxybenzoate polyprenyltransferase